MKRIICSIIILFLFYSCKKDNKEMVITKNNDSVLVKNLDTINESKKLKPAPNFTLPTIDGKMVSLSDFKGKLVYLDIWATWCGPCLVQIPTLKEMEEKYRDTNIIIMSVSIDDDNDKSVWKDMVKSKKLQGVQLFAGLETSFAMDYGVEFIPRFLLIDEAGNILLENAPLPMDYENEGINPEIEKIFSMYLTAKK